MDAARAGGIVRQIKNSAEDAQRVNRAKAEILDWKGMLRLSRFGGEAAESAELSMTAGKNERQIASGCIGRYTAFRAERHYTHSSSAVIFQLWH